MGNNVGIIEEPGTDELDELYKLDATETGPEDGEDDEDGEEEDGPEPEDMPHPITPEDMPHP